MLVEVVQKNADVLFGNGVHLEFQKAAREQPDFMFDYSKGTAATIASKKLAVNDLQGTWYQCPGDSCIKFGCAFKVTGMIPKNYVLNCPMKCSMSKDQTYWKQYVVKNSMAPVSQQNPQ